jgi:SHS2 domain-containing protein
MLVQFDAPSFPALLDGSAQFLRETILETQPHKPTRTETVELTSTDDKELLMDWLRELLFLFSTRSFVTLSVEVKELKLGNPSRLKAVLSGADYDQSRYGLRLEIKTPTYHQYSLTKSDSGLTAVVLFDV